MVIGWSFTICLSPNPLSTLLYPDLYRLYHLGSIDFLFLVGFGQYEAMQEVKGQEEGEFRVFLPHSLYFGTVVVSELCPSMTILPPLCTAFHSFSLPRLQYHPLTPPSGLRVVMTSPGAALGILIFAYSFP